MNMKYNVLLSDPIESSGIDLLKQKCNIVYADSPEDFTKKTKDANAIVIVRNGKVNRETIENSSGLKVITKHGVGIDMIDLTAAKEHNIQVTYTPDSNSISVAEHFITLSLMLAKKMHSGDLLIRNGKWKKDPFDFLGVELYGKNIGIMGLGRIGKHVARICKYGFNMNIQYYDILKQPEFEKEFNAIQVSAETLFSMSDFISINLPLTANT